MYNDPYEEALDDVVSALTQLDTDGAVLDWVTGDRVAPPCAGSKERFAVVRNRLDKVLRALPK